MDTQIKLGTFVFQDLEIPESINFGGTQQLMQHDLVGGQRVIDALGKSDMDITWKGLMQGTDSLTRAQQLNQLRVAGNQLTLTWFNLTYNVVIASFTALTERFYQVRYEIVLKVISDGYNPITSQNIYGFNEAINGDLNTSNNILSNIVATAPSTVNTNPLVSAVADVTSAVQAVPTFNGADATTTSPVTSVLNAALSAVSTAIAPLALSLFGTIV